MPGAKVLYFLLIPGTTVGHDKPVGHDDPVGYDNPVGHHNPVVRVGWLSRKAR